MTNDILEPLLGTCKLNPFFEILINPNTPDDLLVHFGMKHLETVKSGTFEEKLLIGRLYNAGFNRRELHETFKIDFKTMQSYGDALSSGDIDRINNLIFGQGARPKLLDFHKSYIRKKYRKYITIHGCHTTTKIHEELEYYFDLEISQESVRLIINDEKKRLEAEEEKKANLVKIQEEQIEPTANIKKVKGNSKSKSKSKSKKRKKPRKLKGKKKKKFKSIVKNRKREKRAINTKIRKRRNEKLKNIEKQKNLKNKALLNEHNQENSDGEKVENTWTFSQDSCLNETENSNLSPISKVTQYGFPLAIPNNKPTHLSHHLGILLTRMYIDKISQELPVEIDDDSKDLLRQWIAMILLNCKNIENGQKLNYNDLFSLIGKQITTADWQRNKLHEIASEELALNMLRENLKFVNGDYLDTFLYDPHSISYTGMLPILLGWLGGSHKTGKAYYQDFIHTVDGEPVFLNLDDNYYDMRTRFPENIKKLRTILSGDQNRVLTIIVDRAIYDLKYMVDLRENHNINIITWEKNYVKGQWDDTREDIKKMVIQRTRNYKEDTISYQIEYVKNEWSKDNSFAQYTLLLTKPNSKPIELSIICADKNRDAENVLYSILRRWLQENDFAFLIKLGINEITSYKYCSYESIADKLEDRDIKNKERAKLSAKRILKRNKLGALYVKINEIMDKKNDWLPQIEKSVEELTFKIELRKRNKTPYSNMQKERTKLKQKISAFNKKYEKDLVKYNLLIENLKTEINILGEQISSFPAEVSRLEELIKNKFKKLNFLPKTILDCVKTIARNIIYKLLSYFRPIYNNYRNDIVLLQELINASGTIVESKSDIKILLHPTRNYDKKTKNKIVCFLMQMSIEINEFYKNDKTYILDLYEK